MTQDTRPFSEFAWIDVGRHPRLRPTPTSTTARTRGRSQVGEPAPRKTALYSCTEPGMGSIHQRLVDERFELVEACGVEGHPLLEEQVHELLFAVDAEAGGGRAVPSVKPQGAGTARLLRSDAHSSAKAEAIGIIAA